MQRFSIGSLLLGISYAAAYQSSLIGPGPRFPNHKSTNAEWRPNPAPLLLDLRKLPTRCGPCHKAWVMSGMFSSLGPSGPATLLARVAEVGLRLKLRSCDRVDVNIEGSSSDLMRGTVLGVTVLGTKWSSPRLLTCRSILAKVGQTAIAFHELGKGRILMEKPAEGICTVLFNAADMGNFLAHRLLASAELPGGLLKFERRSLIEADRGRVLFSALWQGRTVRFAMSQGQGEQGVVVTALGNECADTEVCSDLSSFFNSKVIDLDGAQLRFKSLCFPTESPECVSLDLILRVERFPNPVTTTF